MVLSKINLPVTNYLKITLNEIVYRTSFIISVPEKKIQEEIVGSPSKHLLLRSVSLAATVEEQQEQVLKRQKMYESHLTKMLKVIDRLFKQDRYGHFYEPCKLQEYIEKIDKPMDLGTMRERAQNHVYSKVSFLASERDKKVKLELLKRLQQLTTTDQHYFVPT